ncbi:MAG: aldehyde dehydrogenase family protein, partial [Acidimicrobiia bacterium]
MKRDAVLNALGITDTVSGVYAGGWLGGGGPEIESFDPTTGERIASVREADLNDYETAVAAAQSAFEEWRMLPPPAR